ncbi:MAG: hypothetical protein WCG27_06680 [Pseudomonadota bacterium]
MPIRKIDTTPYVPLISKINHGETSETREIRQIASDIKKINNETEFYKDTGKLPPVTPDYYQRKINII